MVLWVYIAAVVGGTIIVAEAPNLISLNVAVEVMNALMLPLVLGLLVALATRAVPQSIGCVAAIAGLSSACRA